MIRVSCSKLEDVRKNPTFFVQQLKSEKNSGGGKVGMFQYWQSKVKLLHKGEIDISQATKELQQLFLIFADNGRNKKKQEFLLDRLNPYWQAYLKEGFKYSSCQKQILWKMIPNVALTGHTPVSVSLDGGFAAYYFLEYPISWQEQLRFPLLQAYLAKNIFNCDSSQIKVGYYCLSTLSFDLKNYSLTEIESAILETETMFSFIHEQYKS